MKFTKINTKGFAHHVAAVIVVLAVAIGGTAYLVASHADSCTSPTSGSVSGSVASGSVASGSATNCPVSATTSSPTSTPVSSSSIYAYTCSVSNVAATIVAGAKISPKLTVTNTGTAKISPHMISFVSTNGGPTTYLKEKEVGIVNPGKSQTVSLGTYTISSTTPIGAAQVLSHSDLNFNGSKVYVQCDEAFTVSS